MLEALPIAEYVEYGLVLLRGSWVLPETRFDYLLRGHLGMYRGGRDAFEQVKRELLARPDVHRLELRGKGYVGHLRLYTELHGQQLATAHDAWLLLKAFEARVNEMAPAVRA